MASVFNRSDIKARLSATKKAGLGNVLRNEEGAIDLASIMVGVIVIGIVGSVISATVFAVIPWAQDQAASQSLDAVRTAQSVAYADSATDNIPGAAYLSKTDLVKGTGSGIDAAGLLQNSANIAIDVTPTGYVAASQSGSGAFYYIDSKNPTNIVKVADLTALNTATAAATTVTGTPYVFSATDFAAIS